MAGCKEPRTISKDTPTVKHDSLKIVYHKLNGKDIYDEMIILKELKTKEYSKFIYYYKNLQEDNDTIIAYKDSIFINSKKVTLLKEKDFSITNGKIRIKKYAVDNTYSSSNLYINDRNELVVVRSISSNVVVHYYNRNDPSDLPSQIISDSLFFRPEW